MKWENKAGETLDNCVVTHRVTLETIEREAMPGIDECLLNLNRNTAHQGWRPGSKLKKWFCGCSNLRAAVEVDLSCSQCGGLFRREAC